MKKLKTQNGVALKSILIVIGIIIAFFLIVESGNQNAYREETREQIIDYNNRVTEYNAEVQKKNDIVKQYPYIGVTFKPAKLVPIEIADADDIDSIYYQLQSYENENESIIAYNEQQLEIGKRNIEEYDLNIEWFTSLLLEN